MAGVKNCYILIALECIVHVAARYLNRNFIERTVFHLGSNNSFFSLGCVLHDDDSRGSATTAAGVRGGAEEVGGGGGGDGAGGETVEAKLHRCRYGVQRLK